MRSSRVWDVGLVPRLVLIFCTFCLVGAYVYIVYGIFVQASGLPDALQSLAILHPLLLLLFSATHAVYVWGYLLAAVFLLLSIFVGYISDTILAASGVMRYANDLPAQIGLVPLEVPFSCPLFLYPALSTSTLLVQGYSRSRALSLGELASVAGTTGLMVATAALALEPVGAVVAQLWQWTHRTGIYDGAPPLALVVWFLCAALVAAAFLFVQRGFQSRPLAPLSRWTAALPLVAQLNLLVFFTFVTSPPALGIAVCLALLLPLVVAAKRLQFPEPDDPDILHSLDTADPAPASRKANPAYPPLLSDT